MPAIQQLTLTTDLIRSLIEAGILSPHQQLRLMSANGTWQLIHIKDLMHTNTQLILSHLNASPPVLH